MAFLARIGEWLIILCMGSRANASCALVSGDDLFVFFVLVLCWELDLRIPRARVVHTRPPPVLGSTGAAEVAPFGSRLSDRTSDGETCPAVLRNGFRLHIPEGDPGLWVLKICPDLYRRAGTEVIP